MDLSEIREFVVLAEELNYTTAANKLYISRSSLTKHIQSLEGEIGVKLFIRDNRSVELTPAGDNFFNKAKDLLDCYNNALETTQAIAASGSIELRVGYLFETAARFLPQACADFIQQQSLQLSLRAMEVEEIRAGVTKGELDLGLTTLVSGEVSAGYRVRQLLTDRFGVIVPSSSKLACQQAVTLSDLDGMTLYGPDSHYLPAETKAFNKYLTRAAHNIRIISSISDIGSIIPALTMGAHAVLSVGHVANRFGADFKFIPFSDMEEVPAIALIWKATRETDDLLIFVSCVENALRNVNI